MRYLVTGGTSGLGKEVVSLLAEQAHEIVIFGRNAELYAELVKTLDPTALPTFVYADLMDLESVRSAVQQVETLSFDGLILNAGINSPTAQPTAQGLEPHYGVNVLAHELIIRALGSRLVGSKVVITSSNVQDPSYLYPRLLGIPLPSWQGPLDAARDVRFLSSSQRYSNSKLASVLMAIALQNRAAANGQRVSTIAFDPGLMMDTQLVRDFPRLVQPVYRSLEPILSNIWKGVRPARQSAAMLVSHLSAEPSNAFEYIEGDLRKTAPNPVALHPEQLIQYEFKSISLLADWT